jgi:YD repeat-containing protein
LTDWFGGTYSYNNSNELTAYPGYSWTYDNNGNTTSKTVSGSTTTYNWDFENRMTSVTLPGTGGTVTFKYDPFGRRIEKISNTSTTIYAYDGDNRIEDLSSTGTATARYTQGLGIDEPLEVREGSASYYYHADGLGSIVALTKSTGAAANTYFEYNTFGADPDASETVANPFRFTEWAQGF